MNGDTGDDNRTALSFKSAVELVQVVGQVRVVDGVGADGLSLVSSLRPFQTDAGSISENCRWSLFEYESLASLTALLNLYFDSAPKRLFLCRP